MEIGPVTGVRVQPLRRVAPVTDGPSAVFDLERLSRPGAGASNGEDGKTTGGQDDEADDLQILDDQDSSDTSTPSLYTSQVNLFA